jgi:Flp pilus assembly protein CpaB
VRPTASAWSRATTAFARALPTRASLRRTRLRLAARPLAYWVVTVVLAVVLATVVGRATTTAARAQRQWGATTRVLVAQRDLLPGDVLDASDASLRALPVGLVADGVLTRLPAHAVVAAPIARGEPIHPMRLGRAAASDVAALLPARTRGVALAVPPGLPLRAGDAVDVVATLTGTVVATDATVVHVGDGSAVVAVPVEALGPVAAAVADGGALVALA